MLVGNKAGACGAPLTARFNEAIRQIDLVEQDPSSRQARCRRRFGSDSEVPKPKPRCRQVYHDVAAEFARQNGHSLKSRRELKGANAERWLLGLMFMEVRDGGPGRRSACC